MLKATIKTWQQGVESYKAGKYQDALNSFKSMDEMSKVCYNMGVISLKMNSYTDAMAHFGRAVSCDPFMAVSFFMRGVAGHLKGDASSAQRDYDAAIEKLRGHEFIDYKQLGLDSKLLLCEILFNKALLAGRGGSEWATKAMSCREMREKESFLVACQGVLNGNFTSQPYMMNYELLFLPPRVSDKADKGKKPDNNSVPAATQKSAVASPKPALPPTPVTNSPPIVAPRPLVNTPPAVMPKSTSGPPVVPARPVASETSGAKKLPNRPISMQIKVPMLTLKCFYKDRRLIQIPTSNASVPGLQEKIKAKFEVTNLLIRYKTSDGALLPINTQTDLVKALADGMQELYLNLPGETNQFAPEPAKPVIVAKSTASRVTNEVQTKNTTKSATATTGNTKITPVTSAKTAAAKAKPKVDVWEECFTDSGEKYYYNTVTGETSWEPDRDPSHPWVVCTTDSGDKYYYNPETDQSTWDFPG